MIFATILLAFLGFAAQHEGHGPPASETAGPACVEEALALVESAKERLEIARQSNQPSAMRAAMDDLETTLVAIEAELVSCAGSEPKN